jgi:hypothetical protein
MSLDFPQYVEIKKRSRWLGGLWQVGDKAYYIGLLGMVIVPLAVAGFNLTHRKSSPILHISAGRGLLVFIVCGLIFILSVLLKKHVHNQARKSWPEIYSHEN